MDSGVILVDGKNALYRAAMGTGWLQPGYDGERGAAVHGFMKALLRAARTQTARALVIVVWEGTKNWRREAWPEYKAHRAPPTATGVLGDELAETRRRFEEDQENLRSVLTALGIRQAWPVDGEADDAMATLAKRFATKGVTIFSGDHDMLQCVGPGVRLITPKSEGATVVFETVEEVVAKIGVEPSMISDLKAIAGDNSDNIPGVPGLGPVAAVRLLKAHRDLAGVIMAASDESIFAGTKRQRALMLEHADNAQLFLRLATLNMSSELVHVKPARDIHAARGGMHRLGMHALARQGFFAEIADVLAVR